MEPDVALVFGGLHTLEEMTRDYWAPFYTSYKNVAVSYLAHDDAWKLITNPTAEFNLDYEPEAVERIIAETGGQPLLIQAICGGAIEHLNHELFDEQRDRPTQVTLEDVQTVLGGGIFQRGIGYFDGVWRQAETLDQRRLLTALAQRDEPWTLGEAQTATGRDPISLRTLLDWAVRRDILRQLESEPPRWQFCVPLMRRWIYETGPAANA
jgi:hypothetical protein